MAAAGDKIEEGPELADFLTTLDEIAVDVVEWLCLFQHRETKQFWEMSYPHSEMHGGGPRLLTCLGDTAPSWERPV
jgi:hypothetical protein